MQGKKQFTDQVVTHFRLSERVPPHNLYRRLDELLDLDFLYEATQDLYSHTGPALAGSGRLLQARASGLFRKQHQRPAPARALRPTAGYSAVPRLRVGRRPTLALHAQPHPPALSNCVV